MRIKQVITQHRRDMVLLVECEHCGAEEQRYGYDDDHFHNSVIPSWECPKCAKAADMETYQSHQPKYPEGIQL